MSLCTINMTMDTRSLILAEDIVILITSSTGSSSCSSGDHLTRNCDVSRDSRVNLRLNAVELVDTLDP